MVDIGENRFMNQRRGPQPFTYRVVFDAQGRVTQEGLLSDGMFLRRMRPESATEKDAAKTGQTP